ELVQRLGQVLPLLPQPRAFPRVGRRRLEDRVNLAQQPDGLLPCRLIDDYLIRGELAETVVVAFQLLTEGSRAGLQGVSREFAGPPLPAPGQHLRQGEDLDDRLFQPPLAVCM